MRTLHSALLILVACCQQMRPQLLDFPNRARPSLRLFLAFICRVIAAAFAGIFLLLPAGWPDSMATHLVSVPGVFVACWLTAVGFAAFAINELSSRITRTI